MKHAIASQILVVILQGMRMRRCNVVRRVSRLALTENITLLHDARRMRIASTLAAFHTFALAVVLGLLVLAAGSVKALLCHVLAMMSYEKCRGQTHVLAFLCCVAAVARAKVHHTAVLVVDAVLRDVGLEAACAVVRDSVTPVRLIRTDIMWPTACVALGDGVGVPVQRERRGALNKVRGLGVRACLCLLVVVVALALCVNSTHPLAPLVQCMRLNFAMYMITLARRELPPIAGNISIAGLRLRVKCGVRIVGARLTAKVLWNFYIARAHCGTTRACGTASTPLAPVVRYTVDGTLVVIAVPCVLVVLASLHTCIAHPQRKCAALFAATPRHVAACGVHRQPSRSSPRSSDRRIAQSARQELFRMTRAIMRARCAQIGRAHV